MALLTVKTTMPAPTKKGLIYPIVIAETQFAKFCKVTGISPEQANTEIGKLIAYNCLAMALTPTVIDTAGIPTYEEFCKEFFPPRSAKTETPQTETPQQ
jgi:hypothetical protein